MASDTPVATLSRNSEIRRNNAIIREVQKAAARSGTPLGRSQAKEFIAKVRQEHANEQARVLKMVAEAMPLIGGGAKAPVAPTVEPDPIPAKPFEQSPLPQFPRRERGAGGGETIRAHAVVIEDDGTFSARIVELEGEVVG